MASLLLLAFSLITAAHRASSSSSLRAFFFQREATLTGNFFAGFLDIADNNE
jgi:hypothetical protein